MTFDEQISQAFDTLTGRLRGEIDQEVERRTAEAIAAARSAAPPSDVEPVAPPPADTHASERLAAAFEAIDRARSLTDVLDALVTGARAEAADAELWLIRAGHQRIDGAPPRSTTGGTTRRRRSRRGSRSPFRAPPWRGSSSNSDRIPTNSTRRTTNVEPRTSIS